MTGVNKWNESLFGCFDDWNTCCYGYWCLPCLFGSNAEKISDHNCVGMCCLYSILTSCYACWVPHYLQRKALREKYSLEEDPSCGDLLTTLCCGPCAICQEAREMKLRERNGDLYRTTGPTVISQPTLAPRGVYPDAYRV